MGQYSLAIALGRSAADNVQQCRASLWFLFDRAQVCEEHLLSLIAHSSALVGFACCGDAPGGGALGGDMTAGGDVAEEPDGGIVPFPIWERIVCINFTHARRAGWTSETMSSSGASVFQAGSEHRVPLAHAAEETKPLRGCEAGIFGNFGCAFA